MHTQTHVHTQIHLYMLIHKYKYSLYTHSNTYHPNKPASLQMCAHTHTHPHTYTHTHNLPFMFPHIQSSVTPKRADFSLAQRAAESQRT